MSAKVLPFPSEKRIGKIRRTAEILSGRHGCGAEFYWRQVVDGLISQMERAGLDHPTIDHEIRAFHDAVQRELQGMSGHGRPDGGKAA